MQTQSEPKDASSSATQKGGRWAAHTDSPKRSVFGNYRPQRTPTSDDAPASSGSTGVCPVRDKVPQAAKSIREGATKLQESIDIAMARAFIYGYLAQAFADPCRRNWQWLCSEETQNALSSAWRTLSRNGSRRGEENENTRVRHETIESTLTRPADTLSHPTRRAVAPSQRVGEGRGEGRRWQADAFVPIPTAGSASLRRRLLHNDAFDRFHDDYIAAFGHAARGRCPLNEIEYGDVKADPLFQPHRLADLAGFYRAFGVEVSDDASERHDHFCVECEFMSVLAAREVYALEHQTDDEQLAIVRDAQKAFLREHLGRWTPAFARRLVASFQPQSDSGDYNEPALRALGRFVGEFVLGECARFGVTPGGEDLLLRPADPAIESMCDSCGLTHAPPGAEPAPV